MGSGWRAAARVCGQLGPRQDECENTEDKEPTPTPSPATPVDDRATTGSMAPGPPHQIHGISLQRPGRATIPRPLATHFRSRMLPLRHGGRVRGWVMVNVNVNELSLGLSNATEEQQVHLSHMGHAYATRCVVQVQVARA
jgi:hypothetical protein